jgi:threonine aldolase
MRELSHPFDLVSVALSKGLGAPGGSLLAGEEELILKAHRFRRMFGGAMRQVGIFAAAGIFAIDHNFGRLKEDHDNARMIASVLLKCSRVLLNIETVQTNILIFRLRDNCINAEKVVNKAAEKGVLMFALGPRTIRIVTHLDVSRDECEEAAQILASIIES